MMFSFGRYGSRIGQGGTPFGSSLFMLSILSIGFGLAILSAPELLAYLVAGFFIFTGLWMLGLWWKIKRL